ncbi:MAG TPA: hypothetical protein VGP92_16130 [Acidimicrobiia bacterium]|nr:hypothetical protein [Acidimicrobiia bacterium]
MTVAVEAQVDAPPLPPPDRRLRGVTAILFGAVLAVLAFPLVVALVQLRRPHWYPLLDMAQTEIRVRDITGHPPLIGLAGRIGPFGPNGGSHPGPLSFYALWPVWKLFGGSSYGLFASTVALDIAAIGLSLWMALRRGGRALLLAIAAVLAILMRAYGAFLLTLPWNPYLPVLWWFVFLLAVWSVLADDFAMLPVAVIAGSMCMQTHISYLGLVGGLVAATVTVIAVRAYRRRGDGDESSRRALRRWGAISVVTGVVLWIPPLIDQFAHSPGNLGVIRDYFSHPPDSTIGVHRGVGVLLADLDPWKLLTRTLVHDGGALEVAGSRIPGALLLAAFAVSIVVAFRLRHRALLLLDGVLVGALALGLVSAVRIFGTVWFYLLLWAWSLVALMLFAIGWTAVELVRERNPSTMGSPRPARAGAIALAAVTVVASIVFAVQASSVTVQTPRLNETLGAVVGPTAQALASLRRTSPGPYLVTWLPDAEAIGSAGFGLLNELDRRGFDVRAEEAFRPGATRYHVIDDRRPTFEVHLATGPDIANWRRDSRYKEVASFDPRSTAERAEFARLHDQVAAELRQAGMSDLVPQIDANLFMLALAPRVPTATQRLITQMLNLSMPMAVFIGPPPNA